MKNVHEPLEELGMWSFVYQNIINILEILY